MVEEDADVLLTDWFRRVRESQRVHYECGVYFNRLNYALGIPTIVLTAGVGTAVFASLETAAGGNMRIVVGLTSISATVFSSLQTFLGYAQRADRHRAAGAGYGAVRRSLEHLKTFPPGTTDELKQAMTEIKKEMDDLAKTAPEVPTAMKKRVDTDLKSRRHHRVFHLPANDQGPPSSSK